MDDEKHKDGEGEESLEERDTQLDPDTEEDAVKKAKEGEEAGDDEAGSGGEKRRHKRVKVKLHMVYQDGSTGIQTNVVNISMGGAFLEMAKPPPMGTEIKLTPVLPGKTPSENGDVQLKGKVVRVVEYNLPNMGDKMGVGVEFTKVDKKETNVLSQIFRKCVDEAKSEEESMDTEPEEDDDSAKTGEWSPPKVVDECAKTGEWVSPRAKKETEESEKAEAEKKKEEKDADKEE